MTMHIKNLRTLNWLDDRRWKLASIIKELNRINGLPLDDMLPPFPKEILDLVDQRAAAKGLLSLAMESLAETEKEIILLEVEI